VGQAVVVRLIAQASNSSTGDSHAKINLPKDDADPIRVRLACEDLDRLEITGVTLVYKDHPNGLGRWMPVWPDHASADDQAILLASAAPQGLGLVVPRSGASVLAGATWGPPV
jgi:hypothetical protein